MRLNPIPGFIVLRLAGVTRWCQARAWLCLSFLKWSSDVNSGTSPPERRTSTVCRMKPSFFKTHVSIRFFVSFSLRCRMLVRNFPSSKVLFESPAPRRRPWVQCKTSVMFVHETGPSTAASNDGKPVSSPVLYLRKSTWSQVLLLNLTLSTTGSHINELNVCGPMSRMQAARA